MFEQLTNYVVMPLAMGMIVMGAMFMTVVVTVSFDLDPTAAQWCAEFLQELFGLEESPFINAQNYWGNQGG